MKILDKYNKPEFTITYLACERGFAVSTDSDIEQPEFGGEDNL